MGPTSVIRSWSFLLFLSFLISPIIGFSQALEEIVVTARKMEESLMDIPLSVTAFSGEKMANYDMTELSFISEYIPGFDVEERSGTNSTDIAIRGVATEGENLGFEQSVGAFSDGTFLGRTVWVRLGQFDLERVEVLKGPQSLYFGKNTVAGAFNVVTANPTENYEAKLMASYEFESADALVLEGVVSGPVTETLKARAAVRWRDDDGYMKNIVTGRNVRENDEANARFTLVWEPLENLSFNAKAGWGTFDDTGGGGSFVTCSNQTIATLQLLNSVADCDNPRPVATDLIIPQPVADVFGVPEQGDEQNPRNEGERFEGYYATLTANWDLGDYRITNVSSYRTHELDIISDIDGFELPNKLTRDEEYFYKSNEIRLQTPEYFGRVAANFGFFYDTENQTNNQPRNSDSAIFFFPFVDVNGNGVPYEDIFDFRGQGGKTTFVKAETRSWSFFGSFDVKVTDTLSLVLGGRYTDIKKEADLTTCAGLAFQVSCGLEDDTIFNPNTGMVGLTTPPFFARTIRQIDTINDTDFSPSITVNWKPTDESLLYFSFNEGFKTGGFDFELRTPSTDIDGDGVFEAFTFDAENVDAYEVGTKISLLDGALDLGVALFRSEFDNLQVSIRDIDVTFRVGNAAESTSQGVDIDLVWRGSNTLRQGDNLLLGLAAEVLDSEFDRFTGQCPTGPVVNGVAVPVVPDAPNGLDCVHDGNQRPSSPELSYNLFANYSVPVGQLMGQNLRLTLGGDVSFEDETPEGTDGDPLNVTDPRYKFNAFARLGEESGRWELALIGRNLTDEDDFRGLGTASGAAGTRVFNFTEGRTLTVQGKYSFF